MNRDDIFQRVLGILGPFAKNHTAFATASADTSIIRDLKVNSARLVDVVLEIEDQFGIAVSDEDADQVRTVGDAVELILAHTE